MVPKILSGAFVLLVLLLAIQRVLIAAQNEQESPPSVVWIYRDFPQQGVPDKRSAPERLFGPFGLMPASRTSQITVDQQMLIDEDDASKGTCVEYFFEFKRPDDWVGAYTLVDGNSWGSKPGLNVPKALGLKTDTKLALRFKAKGEGAVSFKIGGVSDGKYKSSLAFPHQAEPSPVTLTPQFKEYTIGPIAARDLGNLIDPFCVVASALDNGGRDSVHVFVDDIRIEYFAKPRRSAALSGDWRRRIAQTMFVTYTPTGFNPTTRPVKQPTVEDIRADLAAVRALADLAGIKGNAAGIVTYGCRDGLENVPGLARDAGLSVILGIFNPRDKTEVENAKRILQDVDLRETIAACCVGNEAITFRRATFDDIRSVAQQIRDVSSVPLTTTEIVQAYGDKRLFSFDFSLVNAHAIFSEIHDPVRGADWAISRIEDLLKASPLGHPIVVKELGWPSGPNPHFTAEQQAQYWKRIMSHGVTKKVNVCIFDGFDNVRWKTEPIALPDGASVNIGPHWYVLFDSDRKPTRIATELIALWNASRPRQLKQSVPARQ